VDRKKLRGGIIDGIGTIEAITLQNLAVQTESTKAEQTLQGIALCNATW